MSFSADDKKAAFLAWEACGKRQTIKIAGNSMSPLLHDGCRAVVGPTPREIKLGDIVVYYRDDVLTIHRIVTVKRVKDEVLFRTKGDNCLTFDPVLTNKREIIGSVVGLVKGESSVNLDSKWWRMGGRLLAVYSCFIGFCTKPFLKVKKNKLVSLGAKILLVVFSIIPRVVSAVFQLKLNKKRQFGKAGKEAP